MAERHQKVHFIGVGGMGMRGLAEMLLRQGWRVSGSDLERSPYLTRLEALGATVFIGQRAEHIQPDLDLVVHTAAVKPSNAEYAAAEALRIPILKYAQMLGRVMAMRRGIAVSGCHGKTTTTAMIAWVLDQAGLNPSFVVGANVPQLGAGSRAGGDLLVVEACEYDRSFHNLRPEIAVMTNVEADHLDYYTGGLPEIIESFAEFARLVPHEGVVVACAESRHAMEACLRLDCLLDTYALDKPEPWTWTGRTCAVEAGCYQFSISHYGEPFGEVRLAVPGRHHALNALAATAVCAHLGVPAGAIAAALADFHGAERRSERKGVVNGVTVVDDYGHHPTEIRCTLKALRDFYQPRRLWCVFQPHQYCRTRHLLEDFARSFADASSVLIPDIYFVRDNLEEKARVNSRILAERIAANGVDAEYVPDFDRITDRLIRELRPGDVLVTLGAGPVWKVADEVLRRLQLRRAG
jgi:UDP-N-acetylmuramate--alanine ligase